MHRITRHWSAVAVAAALVLGVVGGVAAAASSTSAPVTGCFVAVEAFSGSWLRARDRRSVDAASDDWS